MGCGGSCCTPPSRPCIEYCKGEEGYFFCSGQCGIRGSVWGDGPYTADSVACKAARHAGVIGPSGGVFQVIKRPGLEQYTGSDANGVHSLDHGVYELSIAIRSA